MKTEAELNQMILEITAKIRERNPELLKFLNEMPVTIPSSEDPIINVKSLTSYYDSLKTLLTEYEDNLVKSYEAREIEKSQKLHASKLEKNIENQNLKIEINDLNISYKDVGEGIIPVIFLHGFPFDKSMWDGQLNALAASNRLLAVDIRGFGESLDEKTPLSIDLFGNDLIAFMDKLNIQKATICGLSMGGYIALNVVKRFPKRFEALILCDTQCVADTPDEKLNRYKTIDQIKKDGPSEFNEGFIKKLFHPDTFINNANLVERIRDVIFSNTKGIIISGLTALAERFETCTTLDLIHIPTLIICGIDDQITPLIQSEYMLQKIQNSHLKVIKNAGHVSNLEQSDDFNNHLLNFLNSLK